MSRRPLSNTAGYIIIILLCILIGMGTYALLKNGSKTLITKQETVPPIKKTTTINPTPVATTSNNDLYKGITDSGFVSFATKVIDKKCPFYEPDGVTYHQCLSDWVSDLSKPLLTEQVDEVNGYCEMFSKKYSEMISFELSELFTKCVIYKLQP